MFHIFSKKRFLVDSLNGFVDIHNHLLPGIDDGAKTVEDSIAMIREFESFGVTNFIATPHIMHNYYPNTKESIENALGKLKNALLAHDIKKISIEAAAEHMIDDNYENLLAKKDVMSIRKKYLLVEMSYLQPPINFMDAIFETSKKGFYPILAHPERYNFIQAGSGRYANYKKYGIQFQLNLLSLGNYYDLQVQKKALKLIDEGMINYMASDAHNLKHLKALKEIKLSNTLLKKVLPILNNTIETFY